MSELNVSFTPSLKRPVLIAAFRGWNDGGQGASLAGAFLARAWAAQPFATIVMRVLLWMKATLRVNYGWVLVLFGIVIRLLLWPLNQRAMRSSIQMQRLQPELTELQKRAIADLVCVHQSP